MDKGPISVVWGRRVGHGKWVVAPFRGVERVEAGLGEGKWSAQVDPRNRLVATELEERWDTKLQGVERLTEALEALDEEPATLSAADKETILPLGEGFPAVWHADDCPMER